jgi:hypothetical protein
VCAELGGALVGDRQQRCEQRSKDSAAQAPRVSRPTSESRQQGRVVKFALVGDDVGVRPGRCHEVVMADEFADPGPGHPAEVEQRDAAVTEVMRREARHAGGRTSA